MVSSVTLLGVNVSRVNLESAADLVCAWVRDRMRTYVCVAPVSTLVEGRRDRQYADVLNGAGMVTPDGMPVVWLARSQGCAEVARTYGPDLMRKLCRVPGLRHYFLGATPDVLDRLTQVLTAAFPGIIIAGSMAPPFMAEARVEPPVVLETLNKAGADIIWIGLGSPKQDFWMQLNRPHLQAPVLVGVGAAFDFISGAKAQAPAWMQRSGLEWVFRLCAEPKRLWKRYLVGNTLFVLYVILDRFRKPASA